MNQYSMRSRSDGFRDGHSRESRAKNRTSRLVGSHRYYLQLHRRRPHRYHHFHHRRGRRRRRRREDGF